MGRLGELLLFAGLGYGRFRLRDHCFGALYRGAEFLALPSIDRMAVVERLVCGALRTRDQLTKRRNGLGEQLGFRSVSGRLRHLYNPITSQFWTAMQYRYKRRQLQLPARHRCQAGFSCAILSTSGRAPG